MPRFYFQVSGWFYAFLGMFALLGISFLTLLQSQSPQENETSVQVYTLGVPATSIQDIFALEPTIWQQEKANQLNFGYTNKPVWLLVSEGAFVNELSIVELKFPQLDFVDFYVVDLETGAVVDHQLSGDRREFSEKAIPSHRILFRFDRPENAFNVYLRILTDGSNQAPLSISSLDQYLVEPSAESDLLHFFLGVVVFASVLYGMSLFVYRDIAYFYYVILNLSISSLLIFHYRIINIYADFFSIGAQHLAILLSIMAAFYSGIKLVQEKFLQWGFLEFDAILKLLGYVTLFLAFVCCLISYQWSLIVTFSYLAAVAPYIMYALGSFIYNNRDSQYLKLGMSTALGWGVFIAAAFAQILGESGLISNASYVNHGFLVGSFGIVFSMGLILSSSLQLENEQKLQAEKELLTANERLYQADKLSTIATMSSGLIHEIKNPLNWSKGSLIIALKEGRDSSQSDLLEDSLKGIEKIEEIVKGLNWFAKAQPLALKPTRLCELIDRTLELAKSQCIGILIENNVDEKLEVMASETHLAQVIINLLSNSIKAIAQTSDYRQGHIQISAYAEEATHSDSSKLIKLSWHDNGVGMNEALLEKLFDPFYTTSDVNEGIGLGMSITKQIIEKHQGRIEALSDNYNWAQVNIYLNMS